MGEIGITLIYRTHGAINRLVSTSVVAQSPSTSTGVIAIGDLGIIIDAAGRARAW
jgi:hypothetical protein